MPDNKKKKDQQNQEIRSEQEEPVETVASSEEKIQELEQRLTQAEEKYRRALADYQNLERHTAEANIRLIKLATRDFVEDLIRPYDHLRMATQHLKDKGLAMVMDQFAQVFETQGLKEINPLGQLFDPMTMEAIETKEGEEHKVLEVAQVGYELNGIVIQHAKVIVGKKLN